MQSSRWDEVKRKRQDAPWIAVPIGPNSKWKANFLWGLDPDNRPMLLFETQTISNSTLLLPTFSGLECKRREQNGKTTLVFRLLENSLLDIFDQFIDYLVESAEAEENEDKICTLLVNRAWRWHYLLKGGSRLLSVDAQKGLLAELYVLETLLAPLIGIPAAVEAWTGPSDAPKDFETSTAYLEVKARRSGAVDAVQVSSSDQLVDVPGHALLLVVVNVERSDESDPNAKALNCWVDSVRDLLTNSCPTHAAQLLDLIYQAGYDPSDDYSSFLYSFNGHRIFEVKEGFPRITPSSHPADIDFVKYRLKLQDLEAYLIHNDAFPTLLLS